jgi:hypothetical protein
MQSPVIKNLLRQNFSGLPVKDFLQQVVREHPYFAPAHFFLLQHLKEGDADFTQQADVTSLLFNNTHWLNFQLQQTAVKEIPVVNMYADDETETLEKETNGAHIYLHENNLNGEDNTAAVLENSGAADTDDDDAITSPIKNEAASIANETADETNEPLAIKIDLSAAIKNAENENAPAFEPMHLTDYFASQGIKLSEEIQSTDKLGKQLKSFTQWLKTMKKVHVPVGIVSGSEIAVQAMAEKSNTENEVVTEAMAEVFARQGKAAKAIEVYEKLSLLNNGKSAYFATEIEKLKAE